MPVRWARRVPRRARLPFPLTPVEELTSLLDSVRAAFPKERRGFSAIPKLDRPEGPREEDRLVARGPFGGGIELTTLAAVPKGSGLGTSSIMGAVLVAVIRRMIGDHPSDRDLFHAVLKLEQELTTGGGWQDQIGGVVPGVKVITAGPGLVPDPKIKAVSPDRLTEKPKESLAAASEALSFASWLHARRFRLKM